MRHAGINLRATDPRTCLLLMTQPLEPSAPKHTESKLTVQDHSFQILFSCIVSKNGIIQ